MKKLSRFLLFLLGCAALLGAPPVQADGHTWREASHGRSAPRDHERETLQALAGQLRSKADRERVQALQAQVRHGDRDKLRALVQYTVQALKDGKSSAASPGPTGTPPKVLVLYDAPSGTAWDKLGLAYAIMVRNLLGHFDAEVDLVPVGSYAAGQLEGYQATFYLGAFYDHPLPAHFLTDAATTGKTMVWFKYNLWQLAWDPAYNFQANKGLQLLGLRGMNDLPSASNPAPGFFDTVQYKGLDFVKYYAWDGARNVIHADPDIGHVAVTDPAKARVVVPVANPKTGETAPYVVRSGNFWYVADLPLSFIGPRDRYLVFSDLLHDMLGIDHAESHKALVRLEDVGAMVSVQAMKDLSNYMHQRKVPFSIAVIPRYKDGLGTYNGGVPQEVHLSEASNLRSALEHARNKGGEFVMHGFTHQYGNMRNPHTGVSGDDYEFWNIVDNKPFPEDSTAWVLGRLNEGLKDMKANGFTPFAWEAPHYHTSAVAAKTAPQLFPTTYQRVVYYTADKPDFWRAVGKDFSVGQFYPYVIGRDYYGQYVLPENLGNIEYDISTIDPTSNYNYTAQDLVTNAKYAKAVRDGFASFFFHPFWLEPNLGTPGFEDFRKTVEGITELGFTWVAPSTLARR